MRLHVPLAALIPDHSHQLFSSQTQSPRHSRPVHCPCQLSPQGSSGQSRHFLPAPYQSFTAAAQRLLRPFTRSRKSLAARMSSTHVGASRGTAEAHLHIMDVFQFVPCYHLSLDEGRR